MTRRTSSWLGRISVALATAGCGLVSSDVATIKFDLPVRTYSFDTAQMGWNLPPASLPSVACADDQICCAAAQLAGVDCGMVVCDSDSATCALKVTVETPPQSVDLKAEVPELSSLDHQTVIDVTISRITYDDTANTLNVNLPEVEIYVAPQGATSSADPSASKFGTVPVTLAGTTIAGGSVALDPAGQNAFVGFAHDFGTPFVFIAKTTVIVPGGTPLPAGAIDIEIRGQLSAKPSL
jgi:hypothetical protein